MAVYRFSAAVIGRSGGRSATAAAAYRAGERLMDDRTGETHDYSRKEGVLHTEIMTPADTPEWMTDREQLWNAVEAAEKRKDAQLARDILMSLPHELTHDERRELVRDFVQSEFVDRGMIADLAVHLPGGEGDERNHHAHVMLTMRELAGDGFAAKKNRDWNKKDLLEGWRERWAEHQNERFAQLGYDLSVDHRSREERGLEGMPEPKLGPRNAELMRHGLTNAQIEAWKQARAEREELHRINAEIKRFETWAEARKADLSREKLDHTRTLEQKHDKDRAAEKEKLWNFYAEGREKAESALKTVEERQERVERDGITKPVRQWWYRVSGASENDETVSQQSQDALENIQTRTDENMAKLDHAQTEESQNLERWYSYRQKAQSDGIDQKRTEREQQWWTPLPDQKEQEGSATSEWWKAQHDKGASSEAESDQSHDRGAERPRGHEPER